MEPTNVGLTASQLIELCHKGDFERVVAAFQSEFRPTGLSGIAPKLFRELEISSVNQRKAMLLTILHTASDSELSKLRFWPGYFNKEIINSETLKSVPHGRLETFANMLLDFSPQMFFPMVSELCSAGLLKKPRTNGYVAGLISCSAWSQHHAVGLTESLATDSTFRNGEVWLLFEFDGTGESCLASKDKYGGFSGVTWETVLLRLSNEGVLERARLLDETLNALGRDFIQFRAGWFSRFHEALKPTVDERRERLDKYVRLLNSSIPPTVSFAMNAIMLIDKDTPIDFESLSSSLGSALFSKSKQTVTAALTLLQKCAERQVAERRAICTQACSALVNPNTEVQMKVLKILEKFADADDVELKDTFASYASSLAISLKKNVPLKLLPTALNPDAPSPEHFVTAEPSVELRKRRVVAPIADLAELVLKAAFVLENDQAYIEYELVIDAILRGCGRDQVDFAVQTSALLKRAKSRLNSDSQILIKTFCYLLIGWITGEFPVESVFSEESADVNSVARPFRELHQRRMQAIVERVKRKEYSCLLSLPTDEFGWIDHKELKRRLQPKATNFDALDRSLALLRGKELDANLIDSIIGDEENGLTHNALECLRGEKIELENDRCESWGMAYMDFKLKPKPRSIFPGRLLPGFNCDKDFYWTDATALELLLEGSLAPNIREVYFAAGAMWIVRTMSYVEVSDRMGKHFLHFLRDPSILSGEYGSLLVVLAISSVCKDIAVAGVDVFIELVSEDRLLYKYTEEAMCNLLSFGDCIRANRWKQHFDAISRVSPKHSKIVYQLLQSAVASLHGVPRDLHHVLELLVELKAEHGPLQSEAISSLNLLKASGKTKKLIAELISE